MTKICVIYRNWFYQIVLRQKKFEGAPGHCCIHDDDVSERFNLIKSLKLKSGLPAHWSNKNLAPLFKLKIKFMFIINFGFCQFFTSL